MDLLQKEEADLTREIEQTHQQMLNLMGNVMSAEKIADLRMQIAELENRLLDVEDQMNGLEFNPLDEMEIGNVLLEFDGVWQALSAEERAEVLG